MAQTKDLRARTTTPDTPSVGVARYFADASGTLNLVNENGSIYPAGQQWTGNASIAQVPAMNLIRISGTLTGAAYMLRVIGPSGQQLAIPAWQMV